MKIRVPEFALILLMGPPSSHKTIFAKKHFNETEIITTELCHKLINDVEQDDNVNQNVLDLKHIIIKKRLHLRKLTIVDITHESEKKDLIDLAKKYHAFILGIILDFTEQKVDYQTLIDNYKEEGFNFVFTLNSEKNFNFVEINREIMRCNLKNEHGPFDIIGDIHGCFDELVTLLEKLNYKINYDGLHYTVTPPKGRKVIFLGDLVDRGPKIPDVLKIVMDMVYDGVALCVAGNHDNKLLRKLKGNDVQVKHGLENSVEQLKDYPKEFIEEVIYFLQNLESHYILDDGKLVVAHAGMKEEYQGRLSKKVRDFALYGETTGETDEHGLPIRYLWATDYKGKARVLYGHTPYLEVLDLNNTINIDTGCVFGNKLTAYKYPEGEYVSINALQTYSKPSRQMK